MEIPSQPTAGASVLIFANPIAGRGRGKAIAQNLRRYFSAQGLEARIFLQPPKEILDSALGESAIAAVSIGGDGSLRGVAERLVSRGGVIPPILLVPMGTANLMARHLRIRWPRDPAAALLAAMRRRHIVQLDAARANGKLMLLVAGVGFDAQVVQTMEQTRSGPISMFSYVGPILRTLATYDFPPITVRVDGRIVTENRRALALIGNVCEYGTGFPILTHARSDDGLLDVCVMQCQNRFELLRLLMHVMLGDHPAQENVVFVRGRSIDVEASKSVPVEIDGDFAGFAPVKIEMLERTIPFLLPA